jgi:hypothetical protein
MVKLTESDKETRKALMSRYNKNKSRKSYEALMSFEAEMFRQEKGG